MYIDNCTCSNIYTLVLRMEEVDKCLGICLLYSCTVYTALLLKETLDF